MLVPFICLIKCLNDGRKKKLNLMSDGYVIKKMSAELVE